MNIEKTMMSDQSMKKQGSQKYRVLNMKNNISDALPNPIKILVNYQRLFGILKFTTHLKRAWKTKLPVMITGSPLI